MIERNYDMALSLASDFQVAAICICIYMYLSLYIYFYINIYVGTMVEKNPDLALILAFDVKVAPEAVELAKQVCVRGGRARARVKQRGRVCVCEGGG